MKKFLKTLFKIASSLTLFSTVFLTSCSNDESDEFYEVKQVLAGPTNTWCKMPVAYKNSDNDETAETANLYAYFYYATSDKTIGKAELKKGLNLVLTTTNNSDTLFSSLTKDTYFLKSFDEDKKTEVKDSEEDEKIIKVDGSKAKWAAIYWAKEDLRKSENKSTTAPSQVLNGNQGLNLTDLQDFSLKHLLANYLLSILEE